MDRVFSKSKIHDICDDLKDVIKECKEHLEDIKGTANEANNAVAMVPVEARIGAVESAVRNFISAAGDIDFQDLTNKLSNCKTRVQLISSQDKSYGADTDSIKAQINTITQVLAKMEGFMGKTSLTVNYSDFMASLETASTQWNKDLDDTKQAIDQIKANRKGAETISSVFSKDPVNLCTGNFIYDRTDLQIKGSTPFIFRRFYNAINDRAGSLGDDWNHNYEVMLEDSGKEKVLVLEEGKEERFLKTSTGIYTSLYHSNGSLEETEEGYLYKTTARTDYFFDKEGYCLRQEEPNGNVTTMHYEETDNGRHLTRIERSTGEAFSLSYTAEGYLHQVTDHSGRTVTYQMQGTKLIGVCTPKGHWYRYGYSSNGKLESVQNPREAVTVENIYDEQRRMIHQTFPDGGSMSYEYDDENLAVTLTERNGSKVTYIHDENYRDIKHIYRNGEERYEYNKLNQKTLAVDKLGNKTQYGYDEKGNLTRIINALGVKMELAYDEHNQPTCIMVDGKVKVKSRYDSAGNLIGTIDALGNQYRIEYQEKGRPGSITQPDGSRLILTYDERGNITELKDAQGSISQYRYDALNRVIKAIDGNGNETAYEYDAEDNIVSVTNAKGDIRRYEYNESNKVTKITDFDRSEIKREYNNLNRPSKIIDQAGRETLLSYDPMWNLARVTEPNGAKTTFLYNEDNQLGRIRNANGDVVRYTYDANGNRTKITDEEGNDTFFTYDGLGRLTKIKDPAGSETSYTYDAEGNVVKVTDASGNTVFMEYDEAGQLAKEVDVLGNATLYTYSPLGKVRTIKDAAGRETRYEYLPGGLLKGTVYPDGTRESYGYDAKGNLTGYTNKSGFTLTYEYDSLDRVVEIRGSEGERKIYTYDAVGNVLSMTDALGNMTAYEYSFTGKLVKVIDAAGNEVEYKYDACDRLMEIRQYGERIEGNSELSKAGDADLQYAQIQNETNRKCQITSYQRNKAGQVEMIRNALGEKEYYQYDKKGHLIRKQDRDGYVTEYDYTPLGDLGNIRYADGREVKLQYNALRQLIEVEDWMGRLKIEVDAKGRAQEVTYPDGKKVTYEYGSQDERRSITYPDGKEVIYGYDPCLRLKEVKSDDMRVIYGYDEAGRLAEKQFQNGLCSHYRYDRKGQLRELVHLDHKDELDRYEYGYDLLGNKTHIEKMRRGLMEESGSYDYQYDALNRLSGVKKDGILQREYRYDVFHNRKSMNELSVSDGASTPDAYVRTDYTYDIAGRLTRLTKAPAGNVYNEMIEGDQTNGIALHEETYSYDKRGNLTHVYKDGQLVNQYYFGALNRLESIMNYELGQGATYQYNGLGNRVGKIEGTPIEPVLPIDALNNLSLNPIKQLDDVIDLTRKYHNLLQRTEDDITTAFAWDKNVLSAVEGDRVYHYLQDDLGSPIRFIERTGNEREVWGYDEFGRETYRAQSEDENLYMNNSHRVLQPFGFTGYQKDEMANTMFAQAREYQMDNGRFISKDIDKFVNISKLATINQYIYTQNNPMIYVDPSGLVSEKDAKKIIKDNAQIIIDAGKQYDIDPVVIAGCIYVEQVTNVDWKDSISDVPAGYMGLDTSIGVGQVKISTAQLLQEQGYTEVPKVTREELRMGVGGRTKTLFALANNETNIQYVAAYLKYQGDIWSSEYSGIYENNAILASLYNLGHQQRGSGLLGYIFGIGNTPRVPHANPEANPFGTRVADEYEMLAKILQDNSDCDLE